MGCSNTVEALQASGLFDGYDSTAVVERLARQGVVVDYKRGAAIPRADSWPDFHILVDGTVQVIHNTESGREVRLCEFTAGQVFGGFDVMGDSPITVQTVATTDATTVRFPDWTIFDAARVDPQFGLDLLRRAVAVTAQMAQFIIELIVERARDRVRLELVRQARRNMVDRHTGVIEPVPTHAALAAQVGSHREEVSREMSYLRQQALIERSGRRLLVRVDAVENLSARRTG